MQSATQAALLSWSVPPAATLALVLTAVIYLRGWILLRRAGLPFLPTWRAASFLLGLLSLWVALASPLDTFSGFVLTAHMLQHMLLMMVAPPLILMGAPLIPLVRGLPIFAAREFAGPFLNWRVATRLGSFLVRPVVALLLMGGAMFAWHTPRLYELALASSGWHEFEHACFFAASVIFWWPVIQPWPSHTHWPRWAAVPYLLIGDLQNTTLSAILVFSDRAIYSSYTTMPRLFDFSAQQDQAAAGAIMWVVGSVAFVIPAVVIAVQCLQKGPVRVEVPAVKKLRSAAVEWAMAIRQRVSPAKMLRRRFSSQALEAWTFVVLFVVAGLGLAWLATTGGDDDDQALLIRQQSGTLAVSVFGLPELPAGPAEFAVLVQNEKTHEWLPDAVVELTGEGASAVRASSEGSENKLLQVGEVPLAAERADGGDCCSTRFRCDRVFVAGAGSGGGARRHDPVAIRGMGGIGRSIGFGIRAAAPSGRSGAVGVGDGGGKGYGGSAVNHHGISGLRVKRGSLIGIQLLPDFRWHFLPVKYEKCNNKR